MIIKTVVTIAAVEMIIRTICFLILIKKNTTKTKQIFIYLFIYLLVYPVKYNKPGIYKEHIKSPLLCSSE